MNVRFGHHTNAHTHTSNIHIQRMYKRFLVYSSTSLTCSDVKYVCSLLYSTPVWFTSIWAKQKILLFSTNKRDSISNDTWIYNSMILSMNVWESRLLKNSENRTIFNWIVIVIAPMSLYRSFVQFLTLMRLTWHCAVDIYGHQLSVCGLSISSEILIYLLTR